MQGGQKRSSERKFFPGYVLVQMELERRHWHLVKETPRVLGFIGGKADRRRRLLRQKRTPFCSVLRTVWTAQAQDRVRARRDGAC